MKGTNKCFDSHCSSVLFSRSRRPVQHQPALARLVGRSLWHVALIAAATIAGVSLAVVRAGATEWELGGTNTTIATAPIVVAQAPPVVESSAPAKTSGSEDQPAGLSRELPRRESFTRDSGEPGAVAAVEPARSAFVSYLALHNAALRRGGYRPGQIVCIGNGVSDTQAATMQRNCLLNGWSFCTADQDSLDPGFTWHEGASDGSLRMLDAKPTTQLARYRPSDAFSESIPQVIRQYRQPVQTVYYADAGGGFLQGDGGGSCASGQCGGGQQMSMGYQGGGYSDGGYSSGGSPGGGFLSRIFGGGGGGCASGQCGS